MVQAVGDREVRMNREMSIKRSQGRNKNIVLCAKWNMKKEIGRIGKNAIAKRKSMKVFVRKDCKVLRRGYIVLYVEGDR
jgi:hypothetical protein